MFDHSKTPVFTAMKAYRERNVIPRSEERRVGKECR